MSELAELIEKAYQKYEQPAYFVHIYNHDASVHMKMLTVKCQQQQCQRKVTIGLPYCPEHTKNQLKLEIRESTQPNAGFGLFACNPESNPSGTAQLVFKKGTPIVPFKGEVLSEDMVNHRYKNMLPANGILSHNGMTIDPTAERWISGMLNCARGPAHSTVSDVNHAHDTDYLGNVRCLVADTRDIFPLVVAIKDIYDGDELLLDYGSTYWKQFVQRYPAQVQFTTQHTFRIPRKQSPDN